MLALSHFPYVDAGATDHRGLGLAIGEQLRGRIRIHCDKILDMIRARAGRDTAEHVAQNIMAQCAPVFPQYLQELQGMADGAGVAFQDILLTGCEESAMQAARERCTTVAFGGANCVLLGHNEDWTPGFEDCFYVVQAKMPDGTAFLSLAYIASPPGSSIAVNSHGVAFSGNSLLGDHQPGIAKNFLLRSQVEARSLADFERRAVQGPRALANNTMAVDQSGAIVNIEMSLNAHVVIRPEGDCLVHTNHILAQELMHLDQIERACSKARYAAASDMSRAVPHSEALMREILRSHRDWPHSVCLHAQSDGYDDSQTVASAIVDLSDLSLSVANGPPCAHDYVTFHLAA